MQGAIIGGTGMYSMTGEGRLEKVNTPYGAVEVHIGRFGEKELAFLARHGSDHSSPPHRVNYRANMWALHSLGIRQIYATCAVGSNNLNYRPGDLVLLKDFIDFTHQRPLTFHDGEAVHVSMADPYCSYLRNIFMKQAEKSGLEIRGEAVYVCTEGPRFETAAEIRMFQKLGGDVVGMTNVPEVVLAKELKMCYAAVGIVTNWCTGFGEECEKDDLISLVEGRKHDLTEVFGLIMTGENLSQEHCRCLDAVMKL